MHEMHLVRQMFEDLLRLVNENKVERVSRVYLKMGEFSEINEEILRYFFVEHGRGTVLEGAQLVVEKSPLRELRLVSFDCD